jgi:hypothetical protein
MLDCWVASRAMLGRIWPSPAAPALSFSFFFFLYINLPANLCSVFKSPQIHPVTK